MHTHAHTHTHKILDYEDEIRQLGHSFQWGHLEFRRMDTMNIQENNNKNWKEYQWVSEGSMGNFICYKLILDAEQLII